MKHLTSKSYEERMRVGKYALVLFKVMRKTALTKMTSAELFDEFLSLATAHSQAMWGADGSAMRKLYWKLDAVENELKSRPGDERLLLGRLHDHRDAGIRLKAAEATLAVDPIGAREALQKICDRSEFPYAAYAADTLNALDEGKYTPT